MKTADRNVFIVFPIMIVIGLLVEAAGSREAAGFRDPGLCFAGRADLSHPMAGLYPVLLTANREVLRPDRQPHLYHRQHAGPVFEHWRGWQS